jgi:hypothetical protein
MSDKFCYSCLLDLPKSSFGRDKRTLDGLRSNCKECRNKYEKALRDGNLEYKIRQQENRNKWALKNPDKVRELKRKHNKGIKPSVRREQALKHKFNITQDDYEKMLQSQDGLCRICHKESNNKVQKHFHVDHNHETGKIRGLLCNKCNMGLGMFNDNKDLIKKAMDYLERYDG